MTLSEIETALGKHLKAMAACPPIAWGNKASDPALPYLIARHEPVSRIDPTTDGSVPEDQVGLFYVTVVAKSDNFTTEANGIAEAVAVRFKSGTRIAAGSGKVLIDRAEPVAGFQDHANRWAVPVRITYKTEG